MRSTATSVSSASTLAPATDQGHRSRSGSSTSTNFCRNAPVLRANRRARSEESAISASENDRILVVVGDRQSAVSRTRSSGTMCGQQNQVETGCLPVNAVSTVTRAIACRSVNGVEYVGC